MPQMSPMNWIYLLIYFIMIFLISMMMLYFIIDFKVSSIVSYPLKIENFSLKWY